MRGRPATSPPAPNASRSPSSAGSAAIGCPALDRDFVEASNRAYETEREKERIQRERERRTLEIARHNESVALTALANIEAERRPVNAAKLALAAWPRDSEDTMTPKLPETLDALGRIVPNLRERRLLKGH